MDETIQLLKELTEANGVSGYESPIRNLVYSHLNQLGRIDQDKIGSLICEKWKPATILPLYLKKSSNCNAA